MREPSLSQVMLQARIFQRTYTENMVQEF